VLGVLILEAYAYCYSAEMNSCVLLELPESVSKSVLVEWLKVNHLLRVDSAFCSRTLYPRYLSLINGKCTVLAMTLDLNNKMVNSILRWAISRGARLEGLELSGSFTGDNCLLRTFLKSSGSAIRYIRSHNINADISVLKTLQEIASWCPNVKMLSVEESCGDNLWDDCLVEVTTRWQYLVHLRQHQIQYSPGRLAIALAQCRRLEHLDIRSDDHEIPVGIALSSLQSIRLFASNLTDDVLAAVGQRCRKLEVLIVFQSSDHQRYHVTDVGVKAVLQGCPLLRETDVHNARGISIELRAELARWCNLKQITWTVWCGMTDKLAQEVLRVSSNLTSVSFNFCSWLTDTTLAVCAQHCSVLEIVTLGDCPMVSDEGVRAFVATRGATLREIRTRECAQLGDKTALAIAAHCPLLRHLGCPRNVSDAGVVQLVQGCPQLATLDLQECPNISMQGMRTAALHCTSLEKLFLPMQLKGQSLPQFGANKVAVRFSW
jgi:hypothetical protein